MEKLNYKIEAFDGYKESESYKEEIQWLNEKKQITEDLEVLKLLENGNQNFYIETAKRIDNEYTSKIFYNYCERCNQLARTPFARQCKNCSHDWHDVIKANFRIWNIANNESNENELNLVGQLENGIIEIDLKVDLTFLGTSYHQKIEKVTHLEAANKVNSQILLTVNVPDFEDREYLLNKKNVEVHLIK